MKTFKFACPVCGQHLSCDSDKAGSQMNCPTCFQALVVPQAPKGDTSSLLITAAKVGDRPNPAVPWVTAIRPVKYKKPFATIGLVMVVIAVLIAGAVFKNKIFKPPPGPVDKLAAPAPVPSQSISPPSPPSSRTNWTLNLTNVAIPDLPVVGSVHGLDFHCDRATLNGGRLNLRQGPGWPPDLGVSIDFNVVLTEDLAGKSTNITPGQQQLLPEVILRWKDPELQCKVERIRHGYALRINFGKIEDGRLPGKIYLCTPDDAQSWVAGTFDAQIRPSSPNNPAKTP